MGTVLLSVVSSDKRTVPMSLCFFAADYRLNSFSVKNLSKNIKKLLTNVFAGVNIVLSINDNYLTKA